MGLGSALFPAHSRYLPAHRWINIGLRTLHLVGLAGVGAGWLYPVAEEAGRGYWHLTLMSGVLLALLFAWSNGIWLLQLRGQVILLKLALLASILLWPQAGGAILILIIVLSGWIAHAPGDVRYYSLYHRRRVDCMGDCLPKAPK